MDFGIKSEEWQRPGNATNEDDPHQPGNFYHFRIFSVIESDKHLAEMDIKQKDRSISLPDPSKIALRDGRGAATPPPASQASARRPSKAAEDMPPDLAGTPPESPKTPKRAYYGLTRYNSASSVYSCYDGADVTRVHHEDSPERADQHRSVSPPPRGGEDEVVSKLRPKKISDPRLKKLILGATGEAMRGGRRLNLDISDDHWEIKAYVAGSRRDSYDDEPRLRGSRPCESNSFTVTRTVDPRFGGNVPKSARDEEDHEVLECDQGKKISDLKAAQDTFKKSVEASLINDKFLNLLSSELATELSSTFHTDKSLDRDIKVFVTTLQNGETLRKKVEESMQRVEELSQELVQAGSFHWAPTNSAKINEAAPKLCCVMGDERGLF